MAKTPFTRRNALVGYATTRIILPWIRRSMKRKAKTAAKDAAKSGVSSVRHNPKRVSIVLGAAAGAAAWFVAKNKESQQAPPARRKHPYDHGPDVY